MDNFFLALMIAQVLSGLIAFAYFLVTHKRCLFFILLMPVLAYVYYGHLIKIRDFPEKPSGDSACYVYKTYREYNSIFLSMFYEDPAFYKVFDKKSRRCLYTSNFYDDHGPGPDYVLDDAFYSKDCTRFTPPDELDTPQENLRTLWRDVLRIGKEAYRQVWGCVVTDLEKIGIL